VSHEGLFLPFLYKMLGPWGTAALAWLLQHQLAVCYLVFPWLVIVIYATVRLRTAEQHAWGLLRAERAAHRDLEFDDVFRSAYRRWAAEGAGRTWLVPSPSNLWVERVTVEALAARIGFELKAARSLFADGTASDDTRSRDGGASSTTARRGGVGRRKARHARWGLGYAASTDRSLPQASRDQGGDVP